jgi:hypothetical protein
MHSAAAPRKQFTFARSGALVNRASKQFDDGTALLVGKSRALKSTGKTTPLPRQQPLVKDRKRSPQALALLSDRSGRPRSPAAARADRVRRGGRI